MNMANIEKEVESVPVHHPLTFEPKTERDRYLQQKDKTKAGTANTFIRIWLRMRHYPDLNRRDILVYSAVKAAMNSGSCASGSTVVTAECIAHRLNCDPSTVYRSLNRLWNLYVISFDKTVSGQGIIWVDRDFSMPQPEETGIAAKKPLKFNEPKDGYGVSNGFIKVYDRLINFTDLTEMDRLTYSAICYYITANTKSKTTRVKDEAIAYSIRASSRSVNTSIKHLEALGVIEIKRDKTWREISILRDFSKPLPEEIAYYNEHGGSFDTGVEAAFSMTDEEFDDLPF